jgi:hypothetical protein
VDKIRDLNLAQVPHSEEEEKSEDEIDEDPKEETGLDKLNSEIDAIYYHLSPLQEDVEKLELAYGEIKQAV